jgi:hypothetical protein
MAFISTDQDQIPGYGDCGDLQVGMAYHFAPPFKIRPDLTVLHRGIQIERNNLHDGQNVLHQVPQMEVSPIAFYGSEYDFTDCDR